MEKKVLYKVYCGKNHTFYTFKELEKANHLFYCLCEQNYFTYILKVSDGIEKEIACYR